MAKKLGISKEQVGGSTVSIPAPIELKDHNPQYPTGYIFPIAKLDSVYCDPKKTMKEAGVEVEKPVLVFIFKDDKNRVSTHMEFPIDEDDLKFDSKLDWTNQRVRHIWDETIGSDKFPEEGLGTDAVTFEDLYKAIADAFNGEVIKKEGEDKPIKRFNINPCYLKLTYNKDRANFPLFPNFVQRAVVNGNKVPCETLTINPSRDNVKPVVKPDAYTPEGGNTFGSAGSAAQGYDFPDV